MCWCSSLACSSPTSSRWAWRPIITDEVYAVLLRIKESGTSLVVIEQHIRHALEVADEVIVLDRGRVDYTGPADDVDALMEAFHPSDVENPIED